MDENKAKLNTSNSKEYKVKIIQNSMFYIRKSASYLPRLYYLILWKKYLKEENTCKPT